MFEDRVVLVFLIGLIIDVDVVVVFVDGLIGEDVCDNCVEVKVVVEIVDDMVVVVDFGGDLYIIFNFLFNLFKF